MNKYVLIFFLELMKRIMTNKVSLKLTIRSGKLRGYRWLFKKHTNNEAILGVWETLMQNLFSSYLKGGFVVYDLGAHHGFLSLLAAKLVGATGSVYAFEALPSNFKILTKNVEINKIKNVLPIHLAVSHNKGMVTFTNTVHDTANTYISGSPHFSAKEFLEVPCDSLDNLVANRHLPLPDFIKIDVEGAEYDVLCGATELLKTKSPVIYLETHDIQKPGVEKMCLEFLAKNGYTKVCKLENNLEKRMASYLIEKG